MSLYNTHSLEANYSVLSVAIKETSTEDIPYHLPNIQGVILGFVVFFGIVLRLLGRINKEQKNIGSKSLISYVMTFRTAYL